MSLTIKNCLNRWCPRSLQAGGAIGLIRLLREDRLQDLSDACRQGRPPARLACIAPYCHHWEAVDAERGHCLIHSLFGSAPLPAAC